MSSLKQYRIKSKVQTYDIRDSEDYQGILELEAVLNGNSSFKKPKINQVGPEEPDEAESCDILSVSRSNPTNMSVFNITAREVQPLTFKKS